MFQGIFKSAINDANKNYIFGTGSIPINIKSAQLSTFANSNNKQQGYQVAEVNKLISTMLTGWGADGNKPKSMSDNYLELILSCDNGFVVKKRLQFPHIITWKDDSTQYQIADIYKPFIIDNWLKADDFENPDVTLVVEPTDEILTTSTTTPPEVTTTNSGRFYLYYRNLPVGVNRIHIDFHIKTKTEPIDFDLEVIDGLSWKDAQTILASNEQAKINVLLSSVKDVYKFNGAEGDFEDITMHELSALYQQIISLNPNNKFTHDLYFYIYDESELNTKLTDLEQQIYGIHFSEEKTFNSASSILYFTNVGLKSGDKIYIKISGTALWTMAWLYGDAGTLVDSKILKVEQNKTYEITLTSDTNTIGLRIYKLSSAGDVRIDLTKKKGDLDHLYDYVDKKTEGLKIVGLDKGYEVISWDVLIADKEISAQLLHPKTSAGYNLIKLHCKAGDFLRITNIGAVIGTAVLSICSSDFIGNDNQGVIPVIISQQNAATNYDWESPFDCDIVICYHTSFTPVISKFSSPLVEKVAVAENLSWQGKSVVCFGDSLTEFIGNGQGYGDWIAKFTGANVIRVGIGGAQLRQRTTPLDNPTNVKDAYAALDIYNMVKSSCEQDFTKQIAAANWLRDNAGDDNTAIIQRLVDIDWSKVDAVTILGGTNDWHNDGNFFGESGSTDANYTLGAINEIIRLLTSTYKHISLYWFTTIVRYETPSGISIIDARVHENWSDVWKNSAGKTLKDTIQPIIAEVSNNKIPICDMYNTLGWNENNFSQYFNIDNSHPYNGFEQIAKKMIGFINANRTF